MTANSKNSVPKQRLTKRSVEAAGLPLQRPYAIVWDTDLRGFGVRISRTGSRTYFVQARTVSGQQIKLKIGTHGAIAAEQAREIASRELGKIAAGENPAEIRRRSRVDEKIRLRTSTMLEFAVEYISKYAEIYKRPSTVKDECSTLGITRIEARKSGRVGPARKSITILEDLGSRKIDEVTRREIASLHRKMAATPAHANRALALLSHMFNIAIQWDLRTDNPVKGLKRYPEQPRERYLDASELKRLADALCELDNKPIANAIRLLLLTGARRSEVLGATWDQFDLDRGIWTKPSAHTKQNRTHRVPLSPSAVDLLRTVRLDLLTAAKHGERVVPIDPLGPFVFPSRVNAKPITDIKKAWARACATAGLVDVRLHDLRHTFASLLASEGMSLPIIGRLLGHTQPITTARYAHLLDDPLREAATKAANKLEEFTASAGSVSWLKRET